jgi:hypothetical protein
MQLPIGIGVCVMGDDSVPEKHDGIVRLPSVCDVVGNELIYFNDTAAMQNTISTPCADVPHPGRPSDCFDVEQLSTVGRWFRKDLMRGYSVCGHQVVWHRLTGAFLGCNHIAVPQVDGINY